MVMTSTIAEEMISAVAVTSSKVADSNVVDDSTTEVDLIVVVQTAITCKP